MNDVGINNITINEVKIEIKAEDFINLLELYLAKQDKIPTKKTYKEIEYKLRIGIIHDKLNPEKLNKVIKPIKPDNDSIADIFFILNIRM